jgi:hypothetical protein
MMKDVPPDMQHGKLPFCPFSAHYERLLEDLDKKNSGDEFLLAESAQDKHLLLQLQAHLPGCPTCTVILVRARAQRFWQREQLRRLLRESEQNVPSSTEQIMQAIVREKQSFPEAKATSNGHKKLSSVGENLSPGVSVERRRPAKSSSKPLQNVLAFVAVLAVILASFNLFGHLLVFHSPSIRRTTGGASQKKPAIIPVIHTTTWSSVIIALSSGKQRIITSTDPMTGKSALLAFSDYPDATVLDSVSHDGYQVLYHVFDGSKTRYYVRPSTQDIIYTVDGKGGPAIWNTDDSSLFISTPDGVEQVDVKSHRATLAVSSIKAPDLRFYRDGYLYFVARTNADASTGLNRVDLVTGDVTSVTGGLCTLSYDFWPSPGGSMVYYRCKDRASLYAVTNDGTHARMVRADAGQMIGYTAQDEPLTLLRTNTAFQVVKLGVDAQHDQTVVADVVPGASDLPVDRVAVAPYGFSLVALARCSDGSEKLWYDDLVHHTQQVISALSSAQLASSLQVGGWSRLQVPAQE